MQPETLLKWQRQLVANKWDFSHRRKAQPGRPAVAAEIEKLMQQFARENPGRGYDRIVGALANLGHLIADQFWKRKNARRNGVSPEHQPEGSVGS